MNRYQNQGMQNSYGELNKAVQSLLNVCDGASTEDGVGFNGVDSHFIRSVMSKDFCTPKMAIAVRRTLRKYTKQLAKHGVDFNAIPAPRLAEVKETPKKNSSKIHVVKDSEGFFVTNPFDQRLNDLYRKYSFCGWDPINKVRNCSKPTRDHYISLSKFLVDAVEFGYEIELDKEVKAEVDKAYEYKMKQQQFDAEIEATKYDMSIDLTDQLSEAGIKIMPYPYQMAGIKAIDLADGRFLVGDEMGLGKTVQSIAWAVWRNKRTLVICPASLKLNWQNEVNKFSNKTAHVLNGKYDDSCDFTITNYEQLNKYTANIMKSKFDLVIIDESHYIKNGRALRTKRTLKVAKNSDHVIMLTGTAIKSRPMEFYTQLNLLNPAEFRNFMHYARRYCDAKQGPFGWDFTGSSNLAELNSKICSIYVRRNKCEVLVDLPQKIRQTIVVNSAQAIKTEKMIMKSSDKSIDILAALTNTRVELSKLKTDMIVAWIEDFIDQNPNKKVIVFSNFMHHYEKLNEVFGNAMVRVVGADSSKKRQASVDAFQGDDNVKIFFGTVGAAGVGITLTAADTVLFADLPWTPGELMQAEDRAHRIGQESTVNIYKIVFNKTMDAEIDSLLEEKCKILQKVLEGKDVPEGMQSQNVQSELLRRFHIKKEKK
jgi:SWI/SNF-related matrix-associated actin-dependent regulator of chromatin subfamily A-like protein 1